ncbi:hypothetical protein SEEHRA36_06628, partial [Salmonella enterica subsp. enterica serovar Heidelberg str. SARA36]
IPVQEKQSALINVAFSSKTALRGFYIRALSSKVILHIITFYILWFDVQHHHIVRDLNQYRRRIHSA